jgi:pentalenolactone synthase
VTTPKPVQATLPFAQNHPLEPAPELLALQERGAVHRVRTVVGDEGWLVTGYEQVRTLYGGDLVGRAHPCPEQAARATASALFGCPQGNYETDDTDRAWFREVLHGVVGPAALRALRPWVEETVTRVLDDLAAAAKPADFVDLVAIPLPTLVICKLLGIPEEELAHCRRISAAIASARDGQRSGAAVAQLNDYLSSLIAERRVAPDGLLWQLNQAPYHIPPRMIGPIGSALLFSGHYTTAVAIGFGAALLLHHPDQLESLRRDPSKLPGAVEECLRLGNFGVNTGGNGIANYARADFDVEDARIEAGDLVLIDVGAANCDAKAWEEAYRFDIERSPNQHVTFGHGKRFCPGAGLTRLEMQTLFSRLVERFPDLHPAVPLEQLSTHTDQVTGGLVSLPVTW